MSKQTELAQVADTITVDSGNVGIGTVSPGTLVHVSTETAGGAGPVEVMRLEVKEAPSGALDAGDGVKLSFYIPEGTSTSQESAAVAGIRDSGSDSNGAGSLAFYTAGDDAALQQRMRINSSGNVGIGVSSPTAVAANYTTLHLDGSSGSGIHLTKTTSGTTATDGSHLFNAGGDFYLYHYESGNIVFSSGTSATERMRIDSAGRVTKPSQPAFTAQPTSFVGSGGIAGTPTFIFATALLNIGGHFNTSNGRFTAPVAGNYFFTYSITAASSSKNARYFRVRLAKNGTTVINPHNTISDETGDADYNLISASGLVAMNASDYVELNYGSSIDASGLVFYDNMNTFSGFLMS